MTHLRSGDAASAAEVCERALKKFPGDANLLCLLAKAHLALKRFVDAKSRLEEAIKLSPDFATAHETFGDFFLIRGRALEARRRRHRAVGR
ncbi:MAG: tetratricopeptide repeat protein [Proteobacteria bacterium]|nr:tetratricopeptide repeat protein [Pseudomonadota bacterium]